MKLLYAMRRANGDWFAFDDQGSFRVPVFRSTRDAMVARRRDAGMECFRPVALDEVALKNLTSTDEGKATFWLIANPLRNMSHALRLDRKQFEQFIRTPEPQPTEVE